FLDRAANVSVTNNDLQTDFVVGPCIEISSSTACTFSGNIFRDGARCLWFNLNGGADCSGHVVRNNQMLHSRQLSSVHLTGVSSGSAVIRDIELSSNWITASASMGGLYAAYVASGLRVLGNTFDGNVDKGITLIGSQERPNDGTVIDGNWFGGSGQSWGVA